MSEKSKHDHKGTKKLKILIFSIVMLAPFMAVASKVAYTVFNKNAYQSYSGSYKFNGYAIVQDLNQFELNKTYTNAGKNFGLITAFGSHNNIKFKSLEYNLTRNDNTSRTFNSKEYNYAYYSFLTNWILVGYDEYNNGTNLTNILYTDVVNTASFELYSLDVLPAINYWQYPEFFVDTTLSSVYYSAVDELDDASIFSWTTDTGTYTAINNTCTTLGIVSPPLAVLLTYWTLITVIYVIIDIVLESFIYLTHWINDKMI